MCCGGGVDPFSLPPRTNVAVTQAPAPLISILGEGAQRKGEKSFGHKFSFSLRAFPKTGPGKPMNAAHLRGRGSETGKKIGLLFPSFPPAGFWSEVPGSCLALQTKACQGKEGFVRGSGRSHTHKRGRACLAPEKKAGFYMRVENWARLATAPPKMAVNLAQRRGFDAAHSSRRGLDSQSHPHSSPLF